jgi:hypothetical protein
MSIYVVEINREIAILFVEVNFGVFDVQVSRDLFPFRCDLSWVVPTVRVDEIGLSK